MGSIKSYTLAKNYFNKLDTPVKGFYTFEQSAHSPLFEEPERMQKVLLEDVLKNENNFADKTLETNNFTKIK